MKKLKKLFALSLAIIMLACSMAYTISAANHGTEMLYFDGRSAQCKLWHGAVEYDDDGNRLETTLYAQIMYGTTTSDIHFTFVGFTYTDKDNHYCESPLIGTYDECKIREEVVVFYDYETPIDSRGRFEINGYVCQMCNTFNDIEGYVIEECSHELAKGYCDFEDTDF